MVKQKLLQQGYKVQNVGGIFKILNLYIYAIHSDINCQVFKASIFHLKFYRLFVEKLPKHPDYKSAPVDDVTGIKKVSPRHTPTCQCFV